MVARRTHCVPGFSLVELLAAIAVLGLLLALLLPAIQNSRETARRLTCRNNLRQIGVGLQHYHLAYRAFPPGCASRRTLRLAWSAFLLPFLEQSATWERIDWSRPYNSLANQSAASTVIAVYLCPSTTRLAGGRTGHRTGDRNGNGITETGDCLGVTDYGGIFGAARARPAANGVLLFDRSVSLRHITDGSSHTIIVAEDTGRGWRWDGEWINGENIFDRSVPINQQQHNELWSDHPHGCMALFCDGSVHFLWAGIAEETLDALCTREGDEFITAHDYNTLAAGR